MTPKDATEEDFEREVAWVLANLEALSPATRLPIAVERALKRGQAIERARACRAVEAEPELPGEMPDAMWEAIRNDRDAVTETMRIVVRQTKRGILERIEAV